MSHFVTLVLVPDDLLAEHDGDTEQAVAALMERYDENREVDPHSEECPCAHMATRKAAIEEASQVLNLSTARDAFWERHDVKALQRARDDQHLDNELRAAADDKINVAWAETIKPYVDAENAALDRLKPDEKPSPDCETCAGTGTETTTYNPDSKWDWHVIGGRWGDWLSANVLPASSIPADELPCALVNSDGQWHQKAQSLWFGMTKDEMDPAEWDKLARGLIEAHGDQTAVVVDCHGA